MGKVLCFSHWQQNQSVLREWCFADFSVDAILDRQLLYHSGRWVAAEADRMGYRFKGGRALEFVDREPPFGAGADPSNIVDGCYSYGSIQVPGGTEPIVLHRDAVSGGGYFTLGAIISADMDLIGQLQPNHYYSLTHQKITTPLP